MKLDEKAWMAQFCQAVKDEFGGRIVCIGLQGSRGRGEEREDSDIDMVVVLDRVELEDLDRYRRVVANLPCRELLCGFVSGKEELLAWEPGDLFPVSYTHLDVYKRQVYHRLSQAERERLERERQTKK